MISSFSAYFSSFGVSVIVNVRLSICTVKAILGLRSRLNHNIILRHVF